MAPDWRAVIFRALKTVVKAWNIAIRIKFEQTPFTLPPQAGAFVRQLFAHPGQLSALRYQTLQPEQMQPRGG